MELRLARGGRLPKAPKPRALCARARSHGPSRTSVLSVTGAGSPGRADGRAAVEVNAVTHRAPNPGPGLGGAASKPPAHPDPSSVTSWRSTGRADSGAEVQQLMGEKGGTPSEQMPLELLHLQGRMGWEQHGVESSPQAPGGPGQARGAAVCSGESWGTRVEKAAPKSPPSSWDSSQGLLPSA